MEHQSVMLQETLDLLDVKEDGLYVDCTLGRAGHSSEILKKAPRGHLYAFDLDAQAIEEGGKRLAEISDNFTLFHDSFDHLKERLLKEGVSGVDGILLDLGVSSPQFDDPERGFSYRFDARLDMRMDQSQPLSAWNLVNEADEKELVRIFKEYAEEPFARPIARNIVKARQEKPIDTTFELVEIIKKSLPASVLSKKGHPAKRVFQALRIATNRELEQLEDVLDQALSLLNPEGRLVIITFHSLEDRLVKQTFNKLSKPPKTDKRLPQKEVHLDYHLINRKPITASAKELEENNRAHSAKLRGIERNA